MKSCWRTSKWPDACSRTRLRGTPGSRRATCRTRWTQPGFRATRIRRLRKRYGSSPRATSGLLLLHFAQNFHSNVGSRRRRTRGRREFGVPRVSTTKCSGSKLRHGCTGEILGSDAPDGNWPCLGRVPRVCWKDDLGHPSFMIPSSPSGVAFVHLKLAGHERC
jgi:hypothetical protein